MEISERILGAPSAHFNRSRRWFFLAWPAHLDDFGPAREKILFSECRKIEMSFLLDLHFQRRCGPPALRVSLSIFVTRDGTIISMCLHGGMADMRPCLTARFGLLTRSWAQVRAGSNPAGGTTITLVGEYSVGGRPPGLSPSPLSIDWLKRFALLSKEPVTHVG